jgi:hypothetical protein
LSLSLGCIPAAQSGSSAAPDNPADQIVGQNHDLDDAFAALEEEEFGADPITANEIARWDGSESVSETSGMALTGGSGRKPWSGVVGLWRSQEKNYCKILAPYLQKGAQMWQRPYFSVGVTAQAGVGIQKGGGRDFVWDLYNLQFGVFDYSQTAAVIGGGAAGVSVGVNAQMGFGVRADVKSAWEGYFVGASVGGGIPGISSILSGSLSYFTGGNKDSSGRIVGDNTFVGAGLDVEAGLSSPGAASVSGSIGFWTLNQKLTAAMGERFRKIGIPVSLDGAATCNGACVRFDAGRGKASYMRRALTLARSIPSTIGIPASVNLAQVGLLALSVGAMRDQMNGAQACLKTIGR